MTSSNILNNHKMHVGLEIERGKGDMAYFIDKLILDGDSNNKQVNG